MFFCFAECCLRMRLAKMRFETHYKEGILIFRGTIPLNATRDLFYSFIGSNAYCIRFDFFLACTSSGQTLCSQRQMQLRRLNICLVIYFSVLVGWCSLHWQQAHIPCGWDAGFSLLFHSLFFSRFSIFAPVTTSAQSHEEGRNSVTHLLFGIVQKPSHTLPPFITGDKKGGKKR